VHSVSPSPVLPRRLPCFCLQDRKALFFFLIAVPLLNFSVVLFLSSLLNSLFPARRNRPFFEVELAVVFYPPLRTGHCRGTLVPGCLFPPSTHPFLLVFFWGPFEPVCPFQRPFPPVIRLYQTPFFLKSRQQFPFLLSVFGAVLASVLIGCVLSRPLCLPFFPVFGSIAFFLRFGTLGM